MKNLFLDCWLLDAVDDDFAAVWELAAVLQQRQPNINEDSIWQQLLDRLVFLYEKKFILFYQGVHYNGDESVVSVAINEVFVKNEVADVLSTDISKPIVKVYITEAGRAFYLSQCKPYIFN